MVFLSLSPQHLKGKEQGPVYSRDLYRIPFPVLGVLD